MIFAILLALALVTYSVPGGGLSADPNTVTGGGPAASASVTGGGPSVSAGTDTVTGGGPA
jgi:hypothetical protein